MSRWAWCWAALCHSRWTLAVRHNCRESSSQASYQRVLLVSASFWAIRNENFQVILIILRHSLTDRCGALSVGDQILSVDETIVENTSFTSEDVLQLIDSNCTKGFIQLQIIPASAAIRRRGKETVQHFLLSISSMQPRKFPSFNNLVDSWLVSFEKCVCFGQGESNHARKNPEKCSHHLTHQVRPRKKQLLLVSRNLHQIEWRRNSKFPHAFMCCSALPWCWVRNVFLIWIKEGIENEIYNALHDDEFEI